MKISDIVSEAKKNKMPAIALTDNCNVFGAMEFTKACIEKGIQPIIGCLMNVDITKVEVKWLQKKYLGKAKEPSPGLPSGHIPNPKSLPASDLISDDGVAFSHEKFFILFLI